MYRSVTGTITDVGICGAVIVAYSMADCRDYVSGGYGGAFFAFCGSGCFADKSDSGNKENKDKQRLRRA